MIAVELPQLNRRFRTRAQYRSPEGSPYKLLPFRFLKLDTDQYIATNLVGQYVILSRDELEALVDGRLSRTSAHYDQLRSNHFITELTSDVALDLLATKYRTKHAYLSSFTGLHIFVVTLRCDHSCPYCQVSRVSSDRSAYDMTPDTALAGIELMFRSPSPYLKVEFQGGESLLNFDAIRLIVCEVERRNASEGRDIEFVIATNLSPLTDEMLAFAKCHHIGISTSLDGPRELHNANRPRPGNDSYERATAGIERARAVLGSHAVSALMTTTRKSLEQPEAIVDEYVARGFESIFLRWLSPFGFAVKTNKALGYDANAFCEFYRRGLLHVIKINQRGHAFREELASILLRKILTPYDTGYVDLRSPAGLATAVVVYNYEGSVYASDEARMLAEVGDTTFRLGNVHDSYEDLFASDQLLTILDTTMTETVPCCTDCAFQPYCGAEPTFHQATQGDPVGHRPTSVFCHRMMYIFRLLIDLLEHDAAARQVMLQWIAPRRRMNR